MRHAETAAGSSPTIATPLAAPGVVAHALKSLTRPDSALNIRPRLSFSLLRFLASFARHANASAFARGTAALAALAAGTPDLYRDLERDGVDAGLRASGVLSAFDSVSSAGAHLSLLKAAQTSWPVPERVLGRDEVAALEPALTERAGAGFVLPSELYLDPGRYVDSIAALLRGRGVRIMEAAPVKRVTATRHGIRVITSRGELHAETAVVAAGAWTPQVLSGLAMPIEAGRGYSFSVRPRVIPSRPVLLEDAHVGLTPLGARLRVVGTMELSGLRRQHDERRIRAIVNACSPYVADVDWHSREDEWSSLRPITASGLPMIGEVPGRPRVFIGSGHGMFGLTFAPATGRILADLVVYGRTDVDILPFRPG